MSLYEWGLSVPWAMTNTALDAMAAIALRLPIDRQQIASEFHGPQSVTMRDGTRRDDSKRMTMRDGVALIRIDGPIFRYADFFSDLSGGVTTDALARDLQRAVDDPAVRAILFVIDSPGGEATGIGELADAISQASAKKPMASYVEGYGASAAYWLASATGEIAIDASALIGSIGTVLALADPRARPQTRIEFVSSQSPKKRPDPTSEGGRAVLQQLVDDLTEVFISAVMRHRGIERDQVLAVEGGLLVGEQAITAELADYVSSEEAMIQKLAERGRAAGSGQRMKQETSMQLSDMWRGFFQAAKAEGIDIDTGASTPEPEQADTAQLRALQEQLKAAQQRERIANAERFANTYLQQQQILPAQHHTLVALHQALAADDAADTGTRIAQLAALLDERPAHNLTSELVSVPTGILALDRSGNQVETDRAVTDTALTKSPLGRATLKRKRGAHSA